MKKLIEIHKREDNGITLIALIITIVVLLILASISIANLTSDTGIIKETRNAKSLAEKAVLEEQVEMAIIKAEKEFDNPTIEQIKEKIKETTGREDITIDEETGKISIGGINMDNMVNDYIKLPYEPVYLQPGDWEYTIDDNTNTAELTKYKGTPTKTIRVPNYIKVEGKNIPITSIRSYSTYTHIWDTTICDGNYQDYPGSYTNFPTQIQEIIISEGISQINGYVFYNTMNLERIVIPDTVTTIKGPILYNCRSLTEVQLSNKITEIPSGCFRYCGSLTNITIPQSVIAIRNDAFAYCSGLTKITIPKSVTTIENRTFFYCSGLTQITIPESVTTIENNAFSYCYGLKDLRIPESVANIGSQAFYECNGLSGVYFQQRKIPTFGNQCFYTTSGNINFYFANTTIKDAFTSEHYNTSYGSKYSF